MQGSSDVLQFKVPPDKITKLKTIPKRTIQSDYEVSHTSDLCTSYKPVNLNPSKSGPTLAKMLQGKYPVSTIDIQCHDFPPPIAATVYPSKQPRWTEDETERERQQVTPITKIKSQETNLKQKIESTEDLSNPLSRYSSAAP